MQSDETSPATGGAESSALRKGSAQVDATADNYAALHGHFAWPELTDFNIAEVCSARWAQASPSAVAVRYDREDGTQEVLRYGDLHEQADRLAQALAARGIRRGDRVAIILPQRPETAIAHMAVYMLGAVAMPLSILFGPEALAYRLQDSGAEAAFADEAAIDPLNAALADGARHVLRIAVGDAAGRGDADFLDLIHGARSPFAAAQTHADDPALLVYTSGTTGPPKGALIPHRALIGNLSGFVCSQNGFGLGVRLPGAVGPVFSLGAPLASDAPQPQAPNADGTSEVFWSPADWAWTGGLMDALLPTLFFGREIIAAQGRFSPERAFEILQRHGVTHSFLFPTALKAMMKAVPLPRQRYTLRLRAIMSAGEAVGDAVFQWCRSALGVTVNEMFGQTEINYVVGNCSIWRDGTGKLHAGWPARAGSMGRAYPGHRVSVIDEDGRECPHGVPGDVAVHRLDAHGQPDPVFFLGYWNNPAATKAKFTGSREASWCRTGDMATIDADGYLWYQGRSDDMFKAAGYRIGPSEIENCLVKHPAVANAAVVPKPDAERGALVKAYVVLASGFTASDALIADLQAHVRQRLAPYEYPKEIEFIAALPMTTTGKVQRRVLRLQEEARAQQRTDTQA